MSQLPLPPHEAQRLGALRASGILDTPPEERFDRITRLARRLFDVPIVLVSLVDTNRQWFKSCVGLDVSETPRSMSFCAYAILRDDALVIPDARLDERFADNPLVTSEPNIRFYAGQPLVGPNSQKLGTLCIIDRRPRQMSADELEALRELATLAENELNNVQLREALALQRESEARIRSVMDNVADAIVTFDEHGIIESVNRTSERLFGYEASEIVGHDVGMLVPGYVPPTSGAQVSPTASETFTVLDGHYEAMGRRRDGTSFSTDLTVSTMALDNKRLFIGVVRDITERKMAQEELERRDARLREQAELIEFSKDAIVVRDPDSAIIYWNQGATGIYGWTGEEALGKVTHELLRTQFPVSKESVDAALANEGRWEGELVHARRDGGQVVVDSRQSLMHDQEGAPARILEINRDVTERKRAEEERAFLASIVEFSNDAIYSVTPDGTIVTWNRGAEKLFGYPAEEIIGRTIHALCPDDLRYAQEENLEKVRRGQNVDVQETVRVTRDGSMRYVSLTVSPIKDLRGNVVRASAIVRDVTERKRYERALEEAGKAAEEANRAKSEFLANMSHEIRTPMNGVIGMTGLLLDTDLDDEQREYAETVRSSGENLLNIINDVLDFSKIEAGKMDMEAIGFDLRAAVEESVGLLAERAHGKGLELASFVKADVPTALEGDPGRIRQVLVNLLGNAVKFTEDGEVTLVVRLVEESDEEAVVRFEVSDTGIGMSEEQRGRLFRSFSQADASTTRRYGGTGLGLAISKQLVQLMDGEIGVHSEPGAGSVFFFALPLKKQREGTGQAISTPHADLYGQRVLVVDDNGTNRRIMHEQVASWGMRNGMAENGQTALEALREAARAGDPYKLAILDMQMPEMDGVELVRRIKGDPSIAPTKLIMASSMGRGREAEEARGAGIEAYLTKPVRQSKLYDAIATIMAGGEEDAPQRREEKPLVARHDPEEAKARSHAHVLVAEDNAVNQRVAAKMLEKLGYRADVVANGLEAVEAVFSPVPYSAVLMDVQMPEMDGYEATTEIRRREGEGENGRTPIIAMTANAMQGDREKALFAGMDDYVAKPVKSEELEAALERWTSRSEDKRLTSEEATHGVGTSMGGATDPLDRSVLEGLRELGDQELLAELSELFLEDVPPKLEALREAVGSSDASSVGQVAHALKGSSGNMGALRMSTICTELEDAGHSGELERALVLSERLEAEYGRVRAALQAETKGNRG